MKMSVEQIIQLRKVYDDLLGVLRALDVDHTEHRVKANFAMRKLQTHVEELSKVEVKIS